MLNSHKESKTFNGYKTKCIAIQCLCNNFLNKPTDWRGVTFPRVIKMDKIGWAQRMSRQTCWQQPRIVVLSPGGITAEIWVVVSSSLTQWLSLWWTIIWVKTTQPSWSHQPGGCYWQLQCCQMREKREMRLMPEPKTDSRSDLFSFFCAAFNLVFQPFRQPYCAAHKRVSCTAFSLSY